MYLTLAGKDFLLLADFVVEKCLDNVLALTLCSAPLSKFEYVAPTPNTKAKQLKL